MDHSEGDSSMPTILAWLHRGEDILLTLLLLLTLGLAFGQIVLRNLLGSGMVWTDVVVRILVLWLGMLGAMIATREKKHISIDLISRYLSPSRQLAVESVVLLLTGAVCAVAGYFCLIFVIGEYQAGDYVFGQLPAWLCQSILPVAFGVIALRYVIQALMAFTRWRRGGAQ